MLFLALLVGKPFSIPSLSLDTDECASPETNECDLNAMCTNTEGSYVCRCKKGYTGDGKICSGKIRSCFFVAFYKVDFFNVY